MKTLKTWTVLATLGCVAAACASSDPVDGGDLAVTKNDDPDAAPQVKDGTDTAATDSVAETNSTAVSSTESVDTEPADIATSSEETSTESVEHATATETLVVENDAGTTQPRSTNSLDGGTPSPLTNPTLGDAAPPSHIPEGDASNEAPEGLSRSIPGVLLLIDVDHSEPNAFLPDEALSNNGTQPVGAWKILDDTHDCPHEDRTGMVSPFYTTSYDVAGFSPFAPESDAANDFAITFSGGGYQLWGASLGVDLNNPSGTPLPYDLAHGFVGLRFWARSSTNLALKVKLQDKYSAAEATELLCCALDEDSCELNTCGAEYQGCFDAPLRTVEVTPEWQLFELPFADFQRGGWGTYLDGSSAPYSLALDAVYQLQFEVGTDTLFDVYLDNIGLLLEE